MKGKQLAIVLILLVALGGAALFLNRRNAATWSSTATESNGKILNFPLNDVSHIVIKGSGAELNLIKKDDVWKVKERADYPANFELISALIRKLWELRAVQDVKIGPSQFGRLQLVEPGSDPNSGTLLDLKADQDKRIAALLLGKKNLQQTDAPLSGGGIPAGRYVKAEDNANRVFLIADALDEVDPKPARWLSQDFIKVENPKSIALAGPTPDMSWKMIETPPPLPGSWLTRNPAKSSTAQKLRDQRRSSRARHSPMCWLRMPNPQRQGWTSRRPQPSKPSIILFTLCELEN